MERPKRSVRTDRPDRMVVKGYVPASEIGRLINEWWDKQEPVSSESHFTNNDTIAQMGIMLRLSFWTGVGEDVLFKLRSGERKWVHFDDADRIVGAIDPFLRLTDPAVRELFQSADLSWVDMKKPTCPEAVAA